MITNFSMSILIFLFENNNENINYTKIKKNIDVTFVTIYKCCEELEKNKLIEINKIKKNKKRISINLTFDGEEIAKKLIEINQILLTNKINNFKKA
jgi:Mn-dependent DtxR family transcriptional regulator